MNQPGDPVFGYDTAVLAKFRILLRLIRLMYILSPITKYGPKRLFLGATQWGLVGGSLRSASAAAYLPLHLVAPLPLGLAHAAF